MQEEEILETDEEQNLDFEGFSEDILSIIEQYIRSSEADIVLDSKSVEIDQTDTPDNNIDDSVLENVSDLVLSEYISKLVPQLSLMNAEQPFILEEETDSLINANISAARIVQNLAILGDNSVNIFVLLNNQEIIDTTGLILSATNGDDSFIGTIYSDTLDYSFDTVNTDTDTINLGNGADVLNSTVDFELYNNSLVQLGGGNDTINALEIGLENNAVLDTGSGNDTFNVTGIWIYGNSLVDTGSGNDTITGYIDIGDDASLSMGSGNDTIHGNLWVSSATNVYMGDGDDLIRITGTTETLGLYNGSDIYFGDGNDTLDSGNSVPYLQGDIFFGNGDDVFLGNYLYFSSSRSVYMGDGDDIVNTGTQGAYNFDNADFFLGSGNDTFYIRGTGEIEQLWGEADADTYIFSFVGGTTTINDFSVADGDILDISQILTGYDPMTDLISDFARFVDVGADTQLQVDADGGADGFATLVTLIGGAGLDASTLEISGNLDTVV